MTEIHVKFLADGLFEINDIQIFSGPIESFLETLGKLILPEDLEQTRDEMVYLFPKRESRWYSHYWPTFEREDKQWIVYINVHED
jgi:hypothetical protein